MTPAQVETTKIVAGASTTVAAQGVAYAVAVIPLLQVLALLVSIAAGVLTIIWTWKKIRSHT